MDEKNINESEVSPKQIFEQMKKNVYDNYCKYSFSSINKEYLYLRKSLFSILHKITMKMGFKSQTFFLCAHFLDIIFSLNKRINISINLLGLGSLCLSAKYCENDPIVPHLQYFIKAFNSVIGYKHILSVNDLKYAEFMVLKLLNYKLNYYTVYDFNSFLFGHGILKLEQLRDIEYDTNHLYYRMKRKEFCINQSNSLMIKYILEKIYKKSRYYLDILINNTRLSFKYNSLFLSIYIMRKSVIEVLNNEQKIILYDKKEQEEFYKKNSTCFRQIIYEFYNIDYESSEQYRDLLLDEEVLEIFEKKHKRKMEIAAAPPCSAKIKENNEDEKENNNLEINKIRDSIFDNKTVFASSVSNGFYRRLRLKPNFDELNKSQNERSSTRKEKRINDCSNNENTLDNINLNLNINEIHNIYRKRELKNRILTHGNKSTSNINNFHKDNPDESYNTIIQKKIPETNSNYKKYNRLFQRIETYNNFKNKINLNNDNNSTIDYSINTFHGSKYSLNKKPEKQELKTEKNSPVKLERTSINNNFINYSRMNKFSKLKGLNSGKEREDFSYSLINNNNINELNKNNISIIENKSKNIKKSYEKRPYFKKLVHQNTSDNYSFISSLPINAIGNNYISNNANIISEASKNQFDTVKKESVKKKKNENINNYLKIGSLYNKVTFGKVEKENKIFNTLNTSINLGNENTIRSNSIIQDPNKITTSSSRYRRRFFNNNNTNNNNNDLSNDVQNENTVIIKDNNNKRVIEPYIQTSSINNNRRIYSKLPTINSILPKKNNNLIINTSNIKDLSCDNKGVTSNYFYRNRNKINVNTTRNSEIKNSEISKSFIEPKKRISYLIGKQNRELNNTLKEINKAYAKNKKNEIEKEKEKEKEKEREKSNGIKNNNKEININILSSNDEVNTNIKLNYTKSIRQKYLNIHKNNASSTNMAPNSKSISNINNNTSYNNKNENISNNKPINAYSNSISIRNRYSKKNIIKSSENIIDNHNYKQNVTTTKKAEIDDNENNKNLTKNSFFKIINKTKTLFKREVKEEEQNKEFNNNNEKDKNERLETENKRINYKSSSNFYRSHNNFYKSNKIENNFEGKRNKEEISKNQQDKKLGTTYIRDMSNKNIFDKNKKDMNNYLSRKNTSNNVINSNNIENKNNDNISNDNLKYRNIYKRNNVNGIQNNNNFFNNKNDNNGLINRSNRNNSNKNDKNIDNNNINNGKKPGNIINKFSFYRKTYDKINNDNSGNYNSTILKRK